MREIKFKLWDKKNKSWWGGIFTIVFDTDWTKQYPDFIFCQYTGLKDRNGKEIYEGDIIKNVWGWYEVPFEIRWDLNGFRLRAMQDFFKDTIKYCGKNQWIDYPTQINSSEIIGNIYENSELCF